MRACLCDCLNQLGLFSDVVICLKFCDWLKFHLLEYAYKNQPLCMLHKTHLTGMSVKFCTEDIFKLNANGWCYSLFTAIHLN